MTTLKVVERVDLLKGVLHYVWAILAIPILWGLPTAVAYLLVRKVYSSFGMALKLVIAYQGVAMVYAVSKLLGNGGVQPGVEAAVNAGILVWLALRPGRPSLAGMLVYQAIGLIFAGILPFVHQPWGAPAHRMAVAVFVMRASFVVILARALRTPHNLVLPSTRQESDL